MQEESSKDQTLQNFSILHLRMDTKGFLLFYYNCYSPKAGITFSYDSRESLLIVEGNSTAVVEQYKQMNQLLAEYKVSFFSMGFEAGKLMNFLVGWLKDKPSIKYYNTSALRDLNSLSNIHLSLVASNKTCIIGRSKQIEKLKEQLIATLGSVAAVALGIVAVKNVARTDMLSKVIAKKPTESEIKAKNEQVIVARVNEERRKIEESERSKRQEQIRRLKQAQQSHRMLLEQQKRQEEQQRKREEEVRRQEEEKKSQQLQGVKQELQRIKRQEEQKKIKEEKDRLRRQEQEKIRQAYLKKKEQEQKKRQAQLQEKSKKQAEEQMKRDKLELDNRLIKRQVKFPHLLRDEIMNVAKKMVKSRPEFSVHFDNSKIEENVGYIRIFDDNSFILKCANKLASQFIAAIQKSIEEKAKQKQAFQFQVSEQANKKMMAQIDQIKKIEKKHSVKILVNPQVRTLFELKSIGKSHNNNQCEMVYVKQSVCDLLIDQLSSLLIFDRIKDFQRAKMSSRALSNVIEHDFSSGVNICSGEESRPMCEIAAQLIVQYLRACNKQPDLEQRIKLFIFAEQQKLRELVWDLINILEKVLNKSLVFYLVVQQLEEEKILQIPQKCLRYFYLQRNLKHYYTSEGNNLIHRARQSKKNQVILNSDCVLWNRENFRADLQKKTFTNLRNNRLVIQFQDFNAWIQFEVDGSSYRLGESRFREIREAESRGLQQLNISLTLFRLDLKKMTQYNLLYPKQAPEHEVKFQEASLSSTKLIINEDSARYPVQIVTNDVKGALKAFVDMQSLYFRRKSEVLKSHIQVKEGEVENLSRMCAYNRIEFTQMTAKEFAIEYDEGHTGVELIKKYFNMINSELLQIEYPEDWEHDLANPLYKEVEINNKSKEFKKIQTEFPYKITKLVRVQNKNTYSRYFHEKKFLQKEINQGKPVRELLLYHGTSGLQPSIVTGDKQIAFNINYSRDTNYMGRATYFAVNPKYSHNYRFKLNNKSAVMLLCLVLVGDSQKCPKLHQNYLDTDFKDPLRKIRYESMTSEYDGSVIYTVYKNNRAYPLYMIEYSF